MSLVISTFYYSIISQWHSQSGPSPTRTIRPALCGLCCQGIVHVADLDKGLPYWANTGAAGRWLSDGRYDSPRGTLLNPCPLQAHLRSFRVQNHCWMTLLLLGELEEDYHVLIPDFIGWYPERFSTEFSTAVWIRKLAIGVPSAKPCFTPDWINQIVLLLRPMT